MGIKNYSVLKGLPSALALDDDESPHIEIRLEAASTSYRIAVNVRSQLFPHDLLFRRVNNFVHPILAELENLPTGVTSIDNGHASLALDYVRGEFVQREEMSIAPFQLNGPANDLREFIEPTINQGISSGDLEVYAFGETWGPEPGRSDKYFGFDPGNGIHDIHMNQGSSGRFAADNGVNQDGALLMRVVSENRWVALFLAFQSQDWNTDASTGHPIGIGPIPDEPVTPLRPSISIMCAVVNPSGEEHNRESVTLLNRSDTKIELDNWSLVDKEARTLTLGGVIESGETRRFFTSGNDGTLRLANKGGIIQLNAPDGVIAHAVSYSKEQVKREDWTIVFA